MTRRAARRTCAPARAAFRARGEGRRGLRPAVLRRQRRRRRPRALRHHGDARWMAAGRSTAARSSRRLSGAADYYGVLCTEDKGDQHPDARDTLYLAVPATSEGFSISGDWDPLGMRGTVSRNLAFKDVFVRDDEQLMPRGVYFKGAQTWPAMFFTLAPTYLGLANAAYDFTVQLPARRSARRAAGQAPHVPDQADRGGADAHPARGDEEPVQPRHPGGRAQPVEGCPDAPVRRALQRDGRRERHRRAWPSAPAAARA